MRPSAPGYSVRPENRPTGKAWNYFYSLIPRVNSGNAQDENRTEFRLGPLEARDIPVIIDQDSQFLHLFLRFEVANEYAIVPGLTGEIFGAGNLITGVGTLFLSELRSGDVIWVDVGGGPIRYYTVSQILSDTSFRTGEDISPEFGNIGETSPFGKMQSRNTPAIYWPGREAHNYTLTGRISFAGGFVSPVAISGLGTFFLSELVLGDKIRVMDDAGVEHFLVISSIIDESTATAFGQGGAAACTNKRASKFYTDYTDIEFEIYASGGGGQRLLGKGRVLSNQGVNGGGNPEIVPGGGGFAAIRRPYLYGKAGAVTVRVKNLRNDARRVHAHLFGVRIRI